MHLQASNTGHTTAHNILSPTSSIMENIKSNEASIRNIDASHTANDADLLAEIGYKQELKRTFSTFQVFGIAYSIMGVLPSIASLSYLGLSAGPAGFLWAWFSASIMIISVALSMSELASAIPTSGGLYYWTFYYAPVKYRVIFSYFIGFCNAMALCSGLVSICYGNAQEILAAVYLSHDGTFEITTGKTYGVFAGCVITQAFCTCLSSKRIAWLQSTSAICNTGIIILFFIAVPIGNSVNNRGFNDGKFIFGQVNNFSDWPIGFQFVLSLFTAVWTIGAFDSCVHMSEEAKNASHGVPIGILSSVSFCSILGFFIIICINACVNPNIKDVIGTDTGFPLAQIIYDSLGRNWAIAFMSLIATCQWLMGSSILTALSRQIWAFARDDGLPFASYVKVVHPKLKVPIRAVIFACVISLALGCLCLAGTAAANALFSLTVSGNYTAWCTPVLLRLTSGRSRFKPGPFYMGKTLSTINSCITCSWGAFVIVISMIPANKSVDKKDMNYTVVITCGVWILSMVYFFVYKYKHYHGPKSNLSPEEEGAIEAIMDHNEAEQIPVSSNEKNDEKYSV
ncbi:GABA-specific high-affinity permease [Pichia californica]|uniref:GABA-specific high-affinity permease n=1 Tax=Pichia californica TaxID=460514 RepID=A0A9P7BHK1_9ASCO|nr:GABA-specific high-affinity permease [[Candida] californica]KAG0689523.1 GABA-specific high-affinity permease [[Candida] californica]